MSSTLCCGMQLACRTFSTAAGMTKVCVWSRLLNHSVLLLAQAAGTPSNDDGSVIERSTTALESKTGTPSQNAASVAALSSAVNHLSAEAAAANAAP
jgi:hypothetical protein